jgi:hypothetical protein
MHAPAQLELCSQVWLIVLALQTQHSKAWHQLLVHLALDENCTADSLFAPSHFLSISGNVCALIIVIVAPLQQEINAPEHSGSTAVRLSLS